MENESRYRVIAQIQIFDRDVDPRNNFVQHSLNNVLIDAEAIGNFQVALNRTISTSATFDQESNKTSFVSITIGLINLHFDQMTVDFHIELFVLVSPALLWIY